MQGRADAEGFAMTPIKQRPLRTFKGKRYVRIRDTACEQLAGIRGWSGVVARMCSDGSAWVDIKAPDGLPPKLQAFTDPARRNWVRLWPKDCCKREASS